MTSRNRNAGWVRKGDAMPIRLLVIVLLLGLAPMDGWAFMAYISNEKDNTVSVVDLDKMQTVKTIPVGERPRGIALSKDGKLLFVCNGDANHIEVIDLDTLQVTRTLASGPDPAQ